MFTRGRKMKWVTASTMALLLILGCITCVSPVKAEGGGQATTFYVSPDGDDTDLGTETEPFQTIGRAQDAVAAISANMDSDIIIYLRGGRYQVDETLVFDGDDSGYNGHQVIYRNYSNEAPVIDGGIPITGWSDINGDGIYAASVSDGFTFRQLYIDDQRGIRSREPDGTDYYSLQGWNQNYLTIHKSEIANWENINSVEMVITRSYTQNRLRIGSYTISGNQAHVTPMQPDGMDAWSFGAPKATPAAYFMENAFEFIDEPGEWYLDTTDNTVYYKPRANEDMNTIQVIAPKIERIIEINGANNIWFYGLHFVHSTWLRPSTNGYVQRQGGLYHTEASETTYEQSQNLGKLVWHVTPAAIYMNDAHHILFQRNVFKHMGGNAINYDGGTHDNQIVGNVFYELGDTGMMIDMDQESLPFEGTEIQDELIENNYFYKMGRDYSGSMAIFASFPNHLVISHNEIAESDNLAMNLGWNHYAMLTGLQNCIVQYNEVHHVGSRHDDGGGIHLKDYHPGGLIFENWFHDIAKESGYPTGPNCSSGSIFFDDYSDEYTATHNVFTNVQQKIKFHQAKDIHLYNNDTQDQSVKDNAGIQDVYIDIKNYLNGGSIGGAGEPQLSAFEPIIMPATLPLHDDFDDNTVGEEPIEYDVNMLTTGSVTISDVSQDGTKSIEIIDTDNDYVPAVKVYREMHATSNKVISTFRIKAMQQTGAIFLNAKNGTETVATVCLGGGGTIRSWTVDDYEDIMSYASDTWYTIKMELDIASDTYSIYIDDMDTPAASDLSFLTNVNSIDGIEMETGWSTGAFYIDDIQIIAEFDELPIIENFSEDTIDETPSNFYVNIQTTGSATIANVSQDGTKSIKMIDTDNEHGTAVQVYKEIEPQSNTLINIIRIKAMQETGAVFLAAKDGNQSVAKVCLGGAGTIRYWIPGGYEDIMPYTEDTWYTIKLEMDIASNTYQIYINDMTTPVRSDIDFLTDVDSINKMELTTGWSTGTYYIDDIKILAQE